MVLKRCFERLGISEVNKMIKAMMKTCVFAIAICLEEYLFYITLLVERLTKESRSMWATFVMGAFMIATVNVLLLYIFVKNQKMIPKDYICLLMASVLALLIYIALAFFCGQESILEEINYQKEIGYLAMIFLAVLVVAVTFVEEGIYWIIQKIKR